MIIPSSGVEFAGASSRGDQLPGVVEGKKLDCVLGYNFESIQLL